MNSAPLRRLGDVLTLQRGFDLPESQRRHGNVPIVSSSGITGSHDEAKVRGPGVVIGRYGTLGEVYYVKQNFWPLNTSLYVKDFKGNDRRFCAYLLKTIQVVRTVGSSAVPGVNRNVLHDLKVPWLPVDQQRRIASILGAYDDLIEVNRRRIAVLEEMARRLFDEWFVHFRFPGHEVDETGPSEARAWGTADDLIEFDPSTSISRGGMKPFISMGALSTSSSIIAPYELRDGNAGSKFRNGDTLLARITPCLENGKTGLVRGLPEPDGVGFGSTEFIVMRGRLAGPGFTYLLARSEPFREQARKSMSGATGRQRVRIESVRSFPFQLPKPDLLREFERLCFPLLALAGGLGDVSRRLSVARDLLLPRLISGDLSVPAAEPELEAAD